MHRGKIFLAINLLILNIGYFFTPTIAMAQQEATSLGLSVAPQIFEIDVFPGENIKKTIKVRNISDVATPIEVRMTGFTAAQDSGEMLFDESLQDISVASWKWFEIDNTNFILDVEEKEEVQFTISVPENAEPGGHYSVMLFEPRLPSFYFEPGQPRTIPVIGVLFLISVKTLTLELDTENKLEIVEFTIPKEERLITIENFLSSLVGSEAQAADLTIIEKSPSEFILRIKNNDIYHIKPFGKVSIYNIFGGKVGETEVPRQTILPGKTRQFPVEFSLEIPKIIKWLPASISNFLVQHLFIGRYKAKLEIQAVMPLSARLLQPSFPIVLTFFSFPWQFWIPFLIILGALIFFLIKYRKRIKLALKTFLNPKQLNQ